MAANADLKAGFWIGGPVGGVHGEMHACSYCSPIPWIQEKVVRVIIDILLTSKWAGGEGRAGGSIILARNLAFGWGAR